MCPIRLERNAYRELMRIKGILIAQNRRNVSLSESVLELAKVFHKHREESTRTET